MLIRFHGIRKTSVKTLFYALLLLLFVLVFSIRILLRKLEEPGPVEAKIRDFERRIVPGLGSDGGPAYLKGEEYRIGKKHMQKYSMNIALSDRIDLNRTLADPRHASCLSADYSMVRSTASVVIIFYNEAFSVILRTVWSVLVRSPPNLLKEIILVDDASSDEMLLAPLEHYISTRLKNKPVKLVRNKARLGLIRARLVGARLAVGEILVFLDAHCEATTQWLEPLLGRIEDNRTNVVVPIIDVIDSETLHYTTNGDTAFQVGGFTWAGHFNWIDVQDPDYSPVRPVKSPTMAGGLFAIHRQYFWDIGSYDEQMDGWGGENLEMSFRIWQCGGRLETIPCSRVGHIFRDFHPYKFPNDKDTHGINTARLALVWMDQYARLFFMHQKSLLKDPAIGDLTHRKLLRKKLRCKPFSWFLKNVYPEKFIPDENVRAYGRVRNNRDECLDNLQMPEDKIGPLGIYPCHRTLEPTQMFSLTYDGELRQEDSCTEARENKTVILSRCQPANAYQKWRMKHNTGHIESIEMELCLSYKNVRENDALEIEKCSMNNRYQKWTFEYFNKTAA